MVSREGENMSELTKMYIWMAIALIDTYIIIKHEWNKEDKEDRHEH